MILLSSCGEEVQDNGGEESQSRADFYVETTLWDDFQNSSFIEKTWQISSSQDIMLSANANGRVSSVSVKPWDSVYAGQVIARLDDTLWSYGINLDRASIWVERAKINYDSTKLSLDKQVFDAEINLEKLKRNLEILRKDSDQNLIQAQDNFNNSQYDNLDSRAALQIEQLDNNIEKAKLDYDIKVSSDLQQIESFKASTKKEFNILRWYLSDVTNFSDEILWVSEENKNKNNDFEDFLWAQDTNQKRKSEIALQNLIDLQVASSYDDLIALAQSDITQENTTFILEEINTFYEAMISLLIELEVTLNNSIESLWSLGPSELAGFTSNANSLQSQLQWSYGWFIGFKTQVDTFFNTYLDNQASILKSIELQKRDRDIQLQTLQSSEISAQTGLERTVLSIEDSIKNLEDQVISAQNALSNAQSNKSVTLRSLENSIADARVSYSSAAKEYAKLTITSPINGTIWDVMVDVWQEVFSWTNLFDIVSDSTPEIIVSFSALEKELVSIGQKVFVDSGDARVEGTIYSLSEVADENLNYKSTIVFQAGANIIGNIAQVKIPVSTSSMLLPLNIITTKWDEIWTVKTLSWSTFVDVRMRMWEVYGEFVEILSCAKQCEELKIITNDVSNFDENKFTIVER